MAVRMSTYLSRTTGKKVILFLVVQSLAILLEVFVSSAHPQCLDYFPPFDHAPDQQPRFCTTYRTFGCCTVEMDLEVERKFQLIASQYETTAQTSSNCLNFLKDLLCQECSPYAAHIYEAEEDQYRSRQLPGLCGSYCTLLHDTCSTLIPLLTSEEHVLQASARSTADFCREVVGGDISYCFPNVLSDRSLTEWVTDSQTGTGRSQCLCIQEVANNLRNPLIAIHANDSTHRLFVAEQIGIFYVFLQNYTRLDEPFLDIRDSVLTSSRRGDERGLLGAAFHPNFPEKPVFYVFYSSGNSSDQLIRISEFTLDRDDMNKINVTTERIIMQVDQPHANHNGGFLMFGLDGYMYATLGYGGAAGDPLDAGLDKTTLLGKVLRIDVNSETNGNNYAIPPNNPFAQGYENTTVRPEIFAYGVRNMWRCSEDRGDPETGYGRGRLFCGDVGQKMYEEIDIVVNGGNYGWRAREGDTCYKQRQCNDQFLYNEILPIHVYPHTTGKSVTGGYVYRGCQSPNLNGRYIFGDYFNGRLFYLTENNASYVWDSQEICMGDSSVCRGTLTNDYPKNILSFGEDESGELYFLATNSASTNNYGGKVFKIVDPARRGNPSDCVKDKVDVEVRGHVTPFVPSQKKNHHKQIDCLDYSDNKEVTNQTVCEADFVLAGEVVVLKHYSRSRYVEVSVFSVDHRFPNVPTIRGKLSALVTCRLRHCGCPDLKVGKWYLLSGWYQKKRNTFVFRSDSIWLEWHWLMSPKVQSYSLTCPRRDFNNKT